MTGRYASRAGLAQAPSTPPVLIYTAGRAGLSSNQTTWAKILQSHGYKTAAVGETFIVMNMMSNININPSFHLFQHITN